MTGAADACADDYDRVVRDFCVRMDLQDPNGVARGGAIDVRGVHLSMALNRLIPHATVVSIYVDVGMPPASGRASVMRVLLEQNYVHSARRGVAYCISPANGHVLGVIHVGLGGLEGQGLEALVNMLVDVSLELRHMHLLRMPPAEPADEVNALSGGAHA